MITYSIYHEAEANTVDTQFVTIKGSDGDTAEHLCDGNFNVLGQDVSCVFVSSVNIGVYRCVSLRTGGSDGLRLSKVVVNRTWYLNGC